MKTMKQHHFLLTCFPAQGHINPILQLAKILTRLGATATFATTTRGLRRLPTLDSLSYTSFSDGHDDDTNAYSGGFSAYMDDFKKFGSEGLTNILQKSRDDGNPVTCVVYTLLVPWASAVARDMDIPTAFLAIQCATAFAIYHRFFTSDEGGIDSSISHVDIKGLPSFTWSDLPTFLSSDNSMNPLMGPMMQEHFQELERNPNSLLLLNSFQELEKEAIEALIDKNMKAIAIGPLVPSAFADGTDSNDKSFGGDLFVKNEDYFEWLDSKPEKSVVYVAFGSLVPMDKERKMEILHGLMESGRPFLWVIRKSDNEEEEIEVKKMIDEVNSGDGKIVPWCSQVEVLSHKSVGCFVTHCGWNSTLESLVCGVPIIGCPHFSDQTTNAKMVEQVWGNGVRAGENGDVMIKREELKKCLDVVMGDSVRGREIRDNALKWRGFAVESVKDGGSTYNNLREVLEMNLI